jgi:anti-sigma B factor antagonist
MAVAKIDDLPHTIPSRLAIKIMEQGTTTTIALEGEWDLAEQRATRAAITTVLKRSPECVVLDLDQVSFIDSSGVHVLVELHKRSARQNVRLVIVPGPRAIQRLFDISQLTEALPFLSPAH